MGPGASPQDPTALTTQQLLRENFWLRELLQEQIAGITARIGESDKAVKLLQAFADRTPTTMDVQHMVVQLREVAMEKFEGMGRAVDAAFAASKEVIAKSEASFTKQVDGMSSQTGTNLKAIDDKINDMKERITIIESRTSVTDPSTQISLAEVKRDLARITSAGDTSAGGAAANKVMMSSIISIIGLVIAVATAVIMAAKAFM